MLVQGQHYFGSYKIILERTFHQPTTPVWYNTRLFSASGSPDRIRRGGQEAAAMLNSTPPNCSFERSWEMLWEKKEEKKAAGCWIPKRFTCPKMSHLGQSRAFQYLKGGQRVINCFMTTSNTVCEDRVKCYCAVLWTDLVWIIPLMAKLC